MSDHDYGQSPIRKSKADAKRADKKRLNGQVAGATVPRRNGMVNGLVNGMRRRVAVGASPAARSSAAAPPLVAESSADDGAFKGKNRPAELYRTDLISAMKVNEFEAVFDASEHLLVADAWRHEWNNGVQVPVAPRDVRRAELRPRQRPLAVSTSSFKLPKKLLRSSKGADFDADEHVLSPCVRAAKDVCRYDLDDVDVKWLQLYNLRRRRDGLEPAAEEQLERVVERFETEADAQLRAALSDCGGARELPVDEEAACDICASPSSDDDDAIVFCDGCDLCVHQSCYGVGELPEGRWFCRACTLAPGRVLRCALCPNTSGAMKCTRSGTRWAHVSCVYWIPEVRFGDPSKVEPVVKLSAVPEERWSLRCSICEKREGACIQCSVLNCAVAYHVTCAQRRRLTMRAKPVIRNGVDDVELESFCSKHSSGPGGRVGIFDGVDDGTATSADSSTTPPADGRLRYAASLRSSSQPAESPGRRRDRRLETLQRRFWTTVSPSAASGTAKCDGEFVEAVFEFWKLKRIRNRNRPLLPSTVEESRSLAKCDEEHLMQRVRSLVALRQNLEKARNLCYMIERREKTKKLLGDALNDQLPLVEALCPLSDREASLFVSGYLDAVSESDPVFLSQPVDTHSPDVDDKAPGEQQTEPIKLQLTSAVMEYFGAAVDTPPPQRDANFNLTPQKGRQVVVVDAINLVSPPTNGKNRRASLVELSSPPRAKRGRPAAAAARSRRAGHPPR